MQSAGTMNCEGGTCQMTHHGSENWVDDQEWHDEYNGMVNSDDYDMHRVDGMSH